MFSSASRLVLCSSWRSWSFSAQSEATLAVLASSCSRWSRMVCFSSVILPLLAFTFSKYSPSTCDCSLSNFLFYLYSLTIYRQRSSNFSYISLQSCNSLRSSATVLSFSRVSTQEAVRVQLGERYFLLQNSSILLQNLIFYPSQQSNTYPIYNGNIIRERKMKKKEKGQYRNISSSCDVMKQSVQMMFPPRNRNQVSR